MSASGPSNGTVVDRQAVIESYLTNRGRTQALFDLLDANAYYERPIPLRHPIVFYEGHIPAFSVNCFLKKGLDHPGLNAELETMFARGIDPSDQQSADQKARATWPDRDEVQRYARDADRAILERLESGTVEGDRSPVLYRGQGVFTMLEHEVMHQETLLYMWHRFEPDRKRRPASVSPVVGVAAPKREIVRVPAGRVTLGADLEEIPFGWDNEFPKFVVDVADFEIDRYDVTNQDYLAFVEAGGYENPDFWSPTLWARRPADGREHPLFWERRDGQWLWRGMFERLPLPPAWPVYVSHAEASAYAHWKEMRLPTEAEFHRAAYGTPDGTEREHPWGDGEPDETRGNFDFRHWDPVPVGSHPAGASAWGVEDLVGNGFEWTSTPFAGYPGFQAMASYPEFSADFFDGNHFVCKGASPATGRDLVRRSFRNWFRPSYPYMYATFRCVG